MSAITDLIAGVPVSDLDASIEWYTRFFGRSPDMRAGDEVLWDVAEHATLFIEPNAAQASAGRITFAVAGLDALLERLVGQRIEHESIETYSNGVRHVKIPDPDENAIAFAEPPDAPGTPWAGTTHRRARSGILLRDRNGVFGRSRRCGSEGGNRLVAGRRQVRLDRDGLGVAAGEFADPVDQLGWVGDLEVHAEQAQVHGDGVEGVCTGVKEA